jgi:GAF domain-containing protein
MEISGNDLLSMLDSLVDPWKGSVGRRYCHLSNVSALLKEWFADTNWTGFYLREGALGHLLLGPFQGKVACTDIEFGKGVCGKAAETGESQLVADVHRFGGHIACDGASNSELVVPIKDRDGQVVAVIDMDSPSYGRFSEADRLLVEQVASLLYERLWA